MGPGSLSAVVKTQEPAVVVAEGGYYSEGLLLIRSFFYRPYPDLGPAERRHRERGWGTVDWIRGRECGVSCIIDFKLG